MLQRTSLALGTCTLYLACTALLVASASGERELLQAGGLTVYGKPVSATPADLVNDPTGRAHLLAALGNPQAYHSKVQYQLPDSMVNINATLDPATESPIPGNDETSLGQYRVVGNSGQVAVHAMPSVNGEVLFFGRPAYDYGGGNSGGPNQNFWLATDNGDFEEIASLYNSTTNTYEPFHITDAPFCSGHTLLPDGRGLIAGGEMVNLYYPYLTYGAVSVRIMDFTTNEITTVATMDRPRWYPSVMTLPDGEILIVGGSQQEAGVWGSSQTPDSPTAMLTMETLADSCAPNTGLEAQPYWDNPSFTIFNPANNSLSPSLALTILLESWPVNTYPFLFVLPTGSTLVVAGVQMQAIYFSPNGGTQDQAVGALPNLPRPVNYPQWASASLLTLEPPAYKTQVLIAGGSSEFCATQMSPAFNGSYLIDVTPGADHTTIIESTNFPRVMPDLTMLPDGRLFLCNGAAMGVAGGGGPNLSEATDPVTTAEIYDPTKPIGERYTPVGDSQIPRLYHSVAWLNENAEVVIAGSEVTSERRVQIYTPDYLTEGKPRPSISNAPATVGYNESFSFDFGSTASIDRVVFNRFVGATHGVHFDTRQVLLDCTPSSSSVNCQSPPNSSIAPPGIYYLFALYQGVPSVADYVSVGTSTPATPVSSASGK